MCNCGRPICYACGRNGMVPSYHYAVPNEPAMKTNTPQNKKYPHSKWCGRHQIFYADTRVSCPACVHNVTDYCAVHDITYVANCRGCIMDWRSDLKLPAVVSQCEEHVRADINCDECVKTAKSITQFVNCPFHSVFQNHCGQCMQMTIDQANGHLPNCGCVRCRALPFYCHVHQIRHTQNGCFYCHQAVQSQNNQGEEMSTVFEAIVIREKGRGTAKHKIKILDNSIEPFVADSEGEAERKVLVDFVRKNPDEDATNIVVRVRPFN